MKLDAVHSTNLAVVLLNVMFVHKHTDKKAWFVYDTINIIAEQAHILLDTGEVETMLHAAEEIRSALGSLYREYPDKFTATYVEIQGVIKDSIEKIDFLILSLDI